jgi:hypothetical protein
MNKIMGYMTLKKIIVQYNTIDKENRFSYQDSSF